MALNSKSNARIQVFKTEGLKLEKAGPSAMMRNIDLVFAFTFQVLGLQANG